MAWSWGLPWQQLQAVEGATPFGDLWLPRFAGEDERVAL